MRDAFKLNNFNKIFLLLILFFSVLFCCDVVSAEDIFVDDSGGADFTIIQQAIDAANTSDIIYVYSGTYYENIEVNKTITLSGSGSSSTNIIGVDSNKNTIRITVDNVVVSGFSVDNAAGKANHYHGIFMQSVQGCNITDNLVKTGENGIYVLNAQSNNLRGNTIQNNNQKGIRLSNADGNTIQGNVIQSNGDGIYATGSDSNEIFENDILNNGYGIYLASSNSNYIYKNDFDDNAGNNAYDTGVNVWSRNEQGNYWDDYNDYDMDEDGVGDNPYVIDADSQDDYPLGDFLTIDQIPTAVIDSISPSPTIVGEVVFFNGHGSDDGTIIEWEWKSSKDGVICSSNDCTYSDLSVGTHTIMFRVRDDELQWSSYDEEVLVVNPEPTPENVIPVATIVSVSPSDIVVGEGVFFHGYGIDEDGSVISYSWESDRDGFLSAEPTFNSSSLSLGSHVISFKVQDDDEAWSSAKTVSVSVSLVKNIDPAADPGGPYAGVVNASVVLDASDSFDADGEIVKYSWSFGDGTVGSGKVIAHVYNRTGNFSVALTVKDDQGETSVNKTSVVISFTTNDGNVHEGSGKNNDVSEDTPGFEFFVILISVCFILWVRRKR